MDMTLTEQQLDRYSRQILLDEIGRAGQERLLSSKVLIIGIGGLGSPAALYLAGAGVGTIGILDSDKVELSNLHRQVIHHMGDVNTQKTGSTKAKIEAMNSDVTVQTHPVRATAGNISKIIRRYDFVIDCTDNFAAKFLINDTCYFEKKPFSHAGVLRSYGQMITVLPGETACYRCIFRSPPPVGVVPSGPEAGVLGTVPGVIGSLQATEAMKYLLGVGEPLTNALLTYHALEVRFRIVAFDRNPHCPLCGARPEITELKDE
jgi:adenylyltransferase/sulfurtransferase